MQGRTDGMVDPVQEYIRAVEAERVGGHATEHSYRPALKALLESAAAGVSALNEPRRVKCGAPDFSVMRHDAPVGHVECKDVGISLEEVERSEQMERYLGSLDNLILTNYHEFRYYYHGEKKMQFFLAIPDAKGHLSRMVTADEMFNQMMEMFFTAEARPIRTPDDLAARLASLARVINDAICKALDQKGEGESLRQQFDAFKETLLHHILPEDFADMYAQTICYGMFSARVNHLDTADHPFSRQRAAHDLPKTNPFLRKMFEYIAGVNLDESIVWSVDLLAEMLRRCDMAAVLEDFGKATQLDDPVVHFYETFLANYNPRLREARGVYYTPEPVVRYIIRSVDHLLKTEFGCTAGLADAGKVRIDVEDPAKKTGKRKQEVHKVQILDPACGTGTFMHHAIRHIFESLGTNRGIWAGERGYVAEHLLPRLHGFELLMAPYAVAHMKLSWLLRETGYDFPHNERLNIFLTNTLDEAQDTRGGLFAQMIVEEARGANHLKRDAPIMVVMGNPPYSGHSENQGAWMKRLVDEYKVVDGAPLGERNPKWLNDDYVKFIRFAQWRIEKTGYGILAFICNHGYLDNPTFRGMRQRLMQVFDEVFFLDLHGNTKKRETAPDGSKDENVFDIMQGVTIGIFVKRTNGDGKKKPLARVRHADLFGTRKGKFAWLNENDLTTTDWETLAPKSPFHLFKPQDITLQAEYEDFVSIRDIMPENNVGIVTARDKLSIHHSPEEVWKTVQAFASALPEDARRIYDLGKDVQDWSVAMAQKDVNDSGPDEDLVVPIQYRPFDKRFIYYTGRSRGLICRPRAEIMRHMLAGENLGLSTTRGTEIHREWEHVFCTNQMIQHHTVSIKEVNYLFPLYLYPEETEVGLMYPPSPWDGEPYGRVPNLDKTFVDTFAKKLGMTFLQDGRGNLKSTFGPENLFHYIYAVFHAPTYRARYAGFLKIDFPRLPLTADKKRFRSLCNLGERLVQLHLLQSVPTPTVTFPESGDATVDKLRYVDPVKGKHKGRLHINKTQYFDNLPPDTYHFHVGGYQVCHKWLKDRKDRTLSCDEITHYLNLTAALTETLRLMRQIDAAIPDWPPT